MRTEIIATGTELLSGGVLDTNSLFLAEEMIGIGIEAAFKTVVGDNEKDMEETIRRALGRADVVIITGGIGPTEDDITRKVIAKILKRRLVLNEEALKAIHARLAGRDALHAMANDRQALLPSGVRMLVNPVGIAPGFTFEEDGKFIAVLPGVPREMEAMFSEGLRHMLEERFGGRFFIRRKILRTVGMSESAVNQALQDILKREPRVAGLTAKEIGVDIRIVVREASAERSQSSIDQIEKNVRELLGDTVYGIDGQEMEEVVGALLAQRRQKLAIAESCTGGLVSARITDIAGSSEYFMCGAVAYSNDAKTSMLGVPKELIAQHGAVSPEVAAAMAQGIRQAAGADIGLSLTGIAGPGGGSEGKPVGLVYFGLATAQGVKAGERRFLGTRAQIRLKASQVALDMVRRHLIG